MRRITKALSYANVMASFAVFVALGGAAFAVQQAAKNSVTSASIKNGAVTGKDVKDDSLTGGDFKDESLVSTDIAEGAVTSPKLGNNSVNASKILDDAVRSHEIAESAVGVSELANDTVGSGAFKGMNTFTSEGVVVNAGTPQNVSVSCPAGFQLVSGGYAWQEDEANSIIGNTPSETDPNRTWEVRGMVDAGSNTLFAWALCIQP